MRFFSCLVVVVATCSAIAEAQTDPNWAQREMERMQAQQERWDAQAERQRAEQERQSAAAERQRAERDRRSSQYSPEFEQYRPYTADRKADQPTFRAKPEPIRTGNDLYRVCNPDTINSNDIDNIRCIIYIGDVSFGEKVVKFEKAGGGDCFPEEVNLEQMKDIVYEFLRINPHLRHHGATNLAVAAIVGAFPSCKPVAIKR